MMHRLLLSALLSVSLPLGAQAVIDPGMPKPQVIARLGKPAVERSAGDATYLFYANGCARTCGMNDLVLLDKGVVVDAVFRSAKRRYSGASSSPRAIPAAEARRAKASARRDGAANDEPIAISISGKKAEPAAAGKTVKKPRS